MPLPWTDAILDAAYRRGWLLRSVQEKMKFLLERGLHIEQVLLGTGVISVSQYIEVIKDVFGITLERLDQDRFTHAASDEDLPAGIEAATDEEGKTFILASDLWTQTGASWLKGKQNVIPVLRSDVLRWMRTSEPVDFAVSTWWEALSVHKATEVRLALEQGMGEVWIGADAKPAPDLALAPEEVPALQTWFEAGYPQGEWSSTRHAGVESDVLELVHLKNAHPLAQLSSWKKFLDKPNGIMVCIAPDAWLERELAYLLQVHDHAELMASTRLVQVHPQNPQEREVAWHAALAGASLCWIEDAPDEYDWMRALAQAGIPVQIVRSRHTSHGTAWESYVIKG